MNMNTLEKIRYLRFKHRFTQQIVADAIGVSLTTYSKYEKGERNFTYEHIKKLAVFYDVPISYLFDDNETGILISEEDFKTLVKAKDVIENMQKAYGKSDE